MNFQILCSQALSTMNDQVSKARSSLCIAGAEVPTSAQATQANDVKGIGSLSRTGCPAVLWYTEATSNGPNDLAQMFHCKQVSTTSGSQHGKAVVPLSNISTILECILNKQVRFMKIG